MVVGRCWNPLVSPNHVYVLETILEFLLWVNHLSFLNDHFYPPLKIVLLKQTLALQNSQGRQTNQCYSAMALIVFCTASNIYLETLFTSLFVKPRLKVVLVVLMPCLEVELVAFTPNWCPCKFVL